MTDNEDDEFDKAMFQYRGQINKLMMPLRNYGQGVYVDGVIDELVSLGVQFHLRLSGVDIPLEARDLHW